MKFCGGVFHESAMPAPEHQVLRTLVDDDEMLVGTRKQKAAPLSGVPSLLRRGAPSVPSGRAGRAVSRIGGRGFSRSPTASPIGRRRALSLPIAIRKVRVRKRAEWEYSRKRAGPAAGILTPSPNATDDALCVTRREAWATGFDCGAGALLLRTLPTGTVATSRSDAWGFSPSSFARGPNRGMGRREDSDEDGTEFGGA